MNERKMNKTVHLLHAYFILINKVNKNMYTHLAFGPGFGFSHSGWQPHALHTVDFQFTTGMRAMMMIQQ